MQIMVVVVLGQYAGGSFFTCLAGFIDRGGSLHVRSWNKRWYCTFTKMANR